MSQKRGLGRGLAALIPVEEAKKTGLQQVRHEQIIPNPHQPRAPFRDQDLLELAASIQEHGIIQPLVVTRRPDGGFQLIAGERRWRAARLAGLPEVPVIIKDVAPQQMLELALVENVQRADLSPLEEAVAYQHLVEDFGLSQTEVARRVGKSRVAVTNTLRLLQASPKIQAALGEHRITEGHARALLGLESQLQQDAALRIVVQQEFNVRQTEALVQKIRDGAQVPTRPKIVSPPEVRALEERFQEALGTRVTLRAGRKGGRVIIYYYSDEEFQALYSQLTGEAL